MPGLALRSLEFQDFSGGITDNAGSEDIRRFVDLDNVLINDTKKPFSRPGSAIYASSAYQVNSGADPVTELINFSTDDNLLAIAKDKIYEVTTSAITAITGPGGPTFFSGDSTNYLSHSQWQDTLLITNDAGDPVQKLYKNSAGTWQLRTAGLPAITAENNYTAATVLASAIALANSLRTSFLAHIAVLEAAPDPLDPSTVYPVHQELDTVAQALVPAAATDEATLYTLVGGLLEAFNSHQKDSTKYSATYHKPSSQQSLAALIGVDVIFELDPYLSARELNTTDTPTTMLEACMALDDLRLKFYKHSLLYFPHGGFGTEGTYLSNPATDVIGDAVRVGPYVALNLQPIYDLANELKRQKNAHIDATSNRHTGSLTDFDGLGTTSTTASADASSLSTLATLIYELKKDTIDHLLDRDGLVHTAAEENSEAVEAAQPPLTEYTNVVLSFVGESYFQSPEGDWVTQLQWLTELVRVWNLHVDAQDYHSSEVNADELEKVLFEIPVYRTYLYGFCWKYTYNVGTIEYIDRGPVYTKQMQNVLEIGTWDALIQGLPTLANSAYTHYDTTEIVLEIYRSVADGTALYYVGEVDNGTTTFTDTTPDSTLTANETLYTTGGVLDNDPPPVCKYLHVVDDTAYYANITEDGESLPFRVRQAVPGDPDSAPADLYDDVDGDITGISSVKSRVIVFTKGSVFRLDGRFTETGTNGIVHERISDTVGCVSHRGIVQIDGAILFPAIDGFYYTDGYQVQKLSSEFNTTYATCVSTTLKQKRIMGAYDKGGERVFWTAQYDDDTDSVYNDMLFVLDLNYGLRVDACFTTWSNGTNFQPSAICFFNSQLLRGDRRGYIFKHDEDYLTDPEVDTTVAPTSWTTASIIPTITTVSTNFGSDETLKWVPRVTIKTLAETEQSLLITSMNDRTDHDPRELQFIRWRGWSTQIMEESRHFQAGTLRCLEKQLTLSYTDQAVLFNSDAFESATVSSTTATMATESWPALALTKGQTILFDNDTDETEHEITNVSGGTLTFTPASSLTGAQPWRIIGFPREEKLHLLSISIQYAPLTDQKRGYHKVEAGNNS